MNVGELIILGRQLTSIGNAALRGAQDPNGAIPAGISMVGSDLLLHPATSVGEVAQRTGLRPTFVAECVGKLRDQGVVETSHDGRGTLVRLTGGDPGRVTKAASAPADQALRDALGPGTDPRTALTILAVLTELSERLRDAGCPLDERGPDERNLGQGALDEPGPDPTHADATRTDLTRADLTRADLTRADIGITRADRTRTDLTRADATRADATRADLARTRTDLTRADLTRADLTRPDPTRADLTRAEHTLPGSPPPGVPRTNPGRVTRADGSLWRLVGKSKGEDAKESARKEAGRGVRRKK
jgi:hypothetical protein